MTTNDSSSAALVRSPRVGDILRSSWGYDQTNVDYYQVIRVTKASVAIRKISKTMVTESSVTPNKDAFEAASPNSYRRDDALLSEKGATKRVRPHRDGYSVTITDYSSARLWDGTPDYQTPWNQGH